MTVGSQAFRLTMLNETDIPRLIEIDRSAFGMRRLGSQTYRAILKSPEYRLWGVELISSRERHLVAHLWASLETSHVSVTHIAVDPEYQRNRIATALVARLSLWAFRRSSITAVMLIIPEWADEARQLCLQLGLSFRGLVTATLNDRSPSLDYEVYAIDKRVEPDDWIVGHRYRYKGLPGGSRTGVLNRVIYQPQSRLMLQICDQDQELIYGRDVVAVHRVSIDVPEK